MTSSITQWFHKAPHGKNWIPSTEDQAALLKAKGFAVKKLIPEDEHPDVKRLNIIIERGLSFQNGEHGFGLYDADGYLWGLGEGRSAIDEALQKVTL